MGASQRYAYPTSTAHPQTFANMDSSSAYWPYTSMTDRGLQYTPSGVYGTSGNLQRLSQHASQTAWP